MNIVALTAVGMRIAIARAALDMARAGAVIDTAAIAERTSLPLWLVNQQWRQIERDIVHQLRLTRKGRA